MALLDRLAAAIGRVPLRGEPRLARMPGSSIAAPAAAGWVTDFLNAAYFARPADARDVADLRLAFTVLTTRWARGDGGRLGLRDVAAFHRAFAPHRVRARPRGTLDRARLLDGAAALLGDWFPAAAVDPTRRAHGIAFPTAAERDAFDPARRLAHAALGRLTPPESPPQSRHWRSYPAVAVPDVAAVAAFLADPARWPDAGSELGRFTALRRGGLHGQTFEIELRAEGVPRAPVYSRAYVTCTAVLDHGQADLEPYVAGVAAEAGVRAPDDPPVVPAGATPVLAVELTTHEGHVLGRAVSRLLVFGDGDGGGWVRDVGEWDPLPWPLGGVYALGGRAAQEAFWGPEPAQASMLVQLARAAPAAAPSGQARSASRGA